MSASAARGSFSITDGWSRVSQSIGRSVRESQDVAVMLIHLHDVERLYATVGHERAGELLDESYAKLCNVARSNGTVERLSDRKFAMLLSGLRNRGHVRLAAQKIERVLRETIVDGTAESNLSSTIGVVLSPEQGLNPRELLRCAEVALLDGRRQHESVCFYETNSAKTLYRDWDLEGRLADAIEAASLELHYQPKLCLRTNRIVGAEALMRWHERELGPIAPDVFIKLAESTGQIVDLTHFAIQRTCRQLSNWLSRWPRLGIAVNMTPTIIHSTEIVDALASASSIWDIPPESLTMEVTENSLMANPETSHRVLTQIRDFGSRVSIDDFGTGYSSFSYLKRIPADELKIDRTFVMSMLEDPGDHKIVEHTIGIARSFGLSVVAEGIESQDMLDELRRLGCDYVQGYLICKPLPEKEFETFLLAHEVAE